MNQDTILLRELEKRRSALIDRSRRNPLIHLALGPKSRTIVRLVSGGIDGVRERLVAGLCIRTITPADPERQKLIADWIGAAPPRRAPAPATEQAATTTRPAWNYELGVGHERDDPATDLDAEELEKRLAALARKSKTLQAETGLNPLNVAFGTMRWREDERSRTEFHSPILVCAVAIVREIDGHRYKTTIVSTDEEVEINPALRNRLRELRGIDLPDLGEGETIGQYLVRLATLLEDDSIIVERTVTVAALPTSRMAMWRDLDPSGWPDGALEDHPLVPVLLSAAAMDQAPAFARDHDVDAVATDAPGSLPRIIYDADASQMSVLLDIRQSRSRSIAVEGPPGTGKSQTIANIISDALDRGLRVLFVAEKQAALDVVSARLKARGMTPMLFEMHSDTGTKAGVIAQIRERLRHNGETTADLSRRRDEMHALHGRLRAHADASGTIAAPGMDVGAMIWRATDIKTRLPAEVAGDAMIMEDPGVPLERLHDVAQAISSWRLLSAEASEVDPWRGLKLHAHHQRDTIAAAARMLARNVARLKTSASEVVPDPLRITTREMSAWRPLAQAAVPRFTSTGPEIEEAARRADHHRRVIALDGLLADARAACEQVMPGLSRLDHRQVAALVEALRPLGVDTLKEARLKLINGRRRVDEMAERISLLEPLRIIAGSDRPEDLQRAHDMLAAVARHVEDDGAVVLARTPGIDADLRRLHAKAAALRARKTRSDALFRPEAQEADGVEDEMSTVHAARTMDRVTGRYGKALARLKSLLVAPPASASEVLETYRTAETLHYEVQDYEDARPSYVPEEDWKGLETDLEGLASRIAIQRSIRALLHQSRLPEELADDVPAAQRLHDDANLAAALRNAALVCRPEVSLADLRSDMEQECARIERIIDAHAHMPADLHADARTLGAVRDLAERLREMKAFPDASAASSRRLLADVEARGSIGLVEPFATGFSQSDDPGAYLRSACEAVAAVAAPYDALMASLATLAGHLDINPSHLVDVDHPEWEAASRRAEAMASEEAVPAFRRNVSMTLLDETMADLGAFDVMARLPEEIAPDQIGDVLTLAAYARRIDAALRGGAAAILQSGDDMAARAARYREIDADLQKAEARRIVAERVAGAVVPDGISYGPIGGFTELALLEREVDKIKRHLPIRQLVRRAGRALQELMPVWLMSPSSVAQSVPSDSVRFDLVIIDEASQMRPENAIGSLLRAHQAVIVGDRNQMPPSRQFEVQDEEIDEEEASVADEAESILDLANARLSHKRRLRWHYRSRHPDLIAFSNARYYQDELVVMPAPRRAHGLLGVHSHYVHDARYAEGINLDEVRVVVEMVRRLMAEHPEASLAVVAINAHQAELLSIRIEEAALTDPAVRGYLDAHADGPEPFIVRNLENIQGDERDVVVISTVYGPNAVGRASAVLSSPLNRSDGHRRLNVLVSRARSAVHLVTSMQPGEIGRSGPGHRGIDDLKAYLTYARTRELSHARASLREPDSAFEIVVAERLKDAGFTVDYQVGVRNYWIDLGIGHPDWKYGYIAGVECDGAPWHRGLAVRDRDAIRQSVLERMGWRIIRCWSTDWYGDQRREGDRLVALLRERLRELLAEEPPATVEVVTVAADDPTPTDREYGGPIDIDAAYVAGIRMDGQQAGDDASIADEAPASDDDVVHVDLMEEGAPIAVDAQAEPPPATSIREYARRFGIKLKGDGDDDASGPHASDTAATPSLALHRPDPAWRALDLDGTSFYEVVRGLEYVAWDIHTGEQGRVTAHRTGRINGPGTVDYIAVLPDEREYHTKDLYVAIRWLRRRTEATTP